MESKKIHRNENQINISTQIISNIEKNFQASTSISKPKLSTEELEAKRQEMMSNAKWRDDIRKETIDKAHVKLRAEEKQMEIEQSSVLKYIFYYLRVVYLYYILGQNSQTLQRHHHRLHIGYKQKSRHCNVLMIIWNVHLLQENKCYYLYSIFIFFNILEILY